MRILKKNLLIAALVLCGILCIAFIRGKQTAEQLPEESLSTSAEETLSFDEQSTTSTEAEEYTLQEPSVPAEETEPVIDETYDFTLCFAGDVNFDETYAPMQYYRIRENNLSDCISEDLMTVMQNADIMWLNNEFTYTAGGSPLPGKAYTFRADPSMVSLLGELGVDIVGLANNHAYDYGEQSLLDTLDTLDEAGIPYVGAGRTLSEAMKPVYVTIDDKTIAFVAASRAEKNKMTPQATDDSPGILRCYDTELFLQEIREARENADFVIALVHWGTEYSYTLEEVQLTTGKEYLDAGADAVIGAHSHCLQGMEYYDGKPIVYSLGNFWFNGKTLDTMLVQLHFYGDSKNEHLEVQIIPALQEGGHTVGITDAQEQDRIFRLLEDISINIEIDESGKVHEK